MNRMKQWAILFTLVLSIGILSGCNKKKENDSSITDSQSKITTNIVTTSSSNEPKPTTTSIKLSDKSESDKVVDDILKSFSALDDTENSLDNITDNDLLIP